MRTFHTEFKNFGSMEIIHPSFYRIEPDSLCNHVLATLATNMERRLISYFTPTYSLTLYNFKWFIFGEFTLFGRHIGWVVIFRVVKVISSGGSKCTHIKQNTKISQQHCLNPKLPENPQMQQEYKQAHPSTTNIPFRQLTYLQYCMFPSLFEQYVGYLLNEENYQAMSDIFVLYAQTLFQLVPFPIGEDRSKSSLAFLEGSAIAEQLVKRLQFVMANFPVEHVEMIFNQNVPSSLYNLVCFRILKLFNQTEQTVWSISQADAEIFKTYINSIPNYFVLLRLQQDVKKGKKILNLQNAQQEIKSAETYHRQILSYVSQDSTIYYDFSARYKKMVQKLKFVFKPSISQQKQDMVAQTNKLDFENSVDNQRLENVHVNSFYLKCLSIKEKMAFIKKCYDLATNKGKMGVEKLKQIELMCLLCLEELKTIKITGKLQVYLLLIAIKTQRKGNTENLLQQLKLLFSFDKIPNINYIFPLISSIISIRNPDQLSTQIIDFILKSYSKIHNNNDQNYVRLALVSSLYLHHKVSVIKNSSRKLQLEKLCEYQDIIQYFNNVEILDYLIQLVLCGKEIKLFDKSGRFQYEGLGHVFGIKDIETHFREYLIKTSISQDAQDQIAQISNKKLSCLLSILLQKRSKLISLSDPHQYFHNHLLSLISQTQNCTKFTHKTIRSCLSILQQYSIMSPYHELNQKTIKLIFFILILSLEKYRKEALLCYVLSVNIETISWQKVDSFVRSNSEQFVKISGELFSCIPAFDLVQILVQNCRLYEPMMNEWILQDENLISSWSDSRKDKALLSKRSRLINYLVQKLPAEPQ